MKIFDRLNSITIDTIDTDKEEIRKYLTELMEFYHEWKQEVVFEDMYKKGEKFSYDKWCKTRSELATLKVNLQSIWCELNIHSAVLFGDRISIEQKEMTVKFLNLIKENPIHKPDEFDYMPLSVARSGKSVKYREQLEIE